MHTHTPFIYGFVIDWLSSKYLIHFVQRIEICYEVSLQTGGFEVLDKDLLLYWYYTIQENYPDLKKGNKLYGELAFLRDVITNQYGNVNNNPDLKWLIILKLTIPKKHYNIDYRKIIKEKKVNKFRRLYDSKNKLYRDFLTKQIVYQDPEKEKKSDWKQAKSLQRRRLKECYLIPDEKRFARLYVSLNKYLKEGRSNVQKDFDILDKIINWVIPKPMNRHISQLVAQIEQQNIMVASGSQYLFQNRGDIFYLSFGEGKEFTRNRLKGLEYIRTLLANEGGKISVIDLLGKDVNTPDDSYSDSSIFDAGLFPASSLSILKARQLSKGEIAEIEKLKERYEELDLIGNNAEAEEVLDKIRLILEKSSGDEIPSIKNARVRVKNAITRAIKSIRTEDKDFANYLLNNIVTGFECYYNPPESKGWVT